MNEVPTYTPPEGVHGPTLGRDLPDGCERLRASIYPNFRDEWWDGPGVTNDCLYWWRTVPLKVGDTVQLTGTVEWVDEGGGVQRLPVVPPWYLAQDVWMALGGDSNAFDAWAHHEDDRRTWGDAWAQIVAAVEGSRMEGDTNPPPGSILDLPSYQWVREPPAPPWPGDENDDTARLSPDQGDRIVNACCRMLGCEPADIDGDAALEEILTEAVERCADLHGQDRWEDDCHGCGFRVGDHTTDGRCPAPAAPAPPWPGAVLSGLVDEDGEPTWLAQAPNVQGEAVRTCVDFPWFICGSDNAVTPYWVEVRAPRAVPEPETERVEPVTVRFYEAFGPTDFTEGRGPRKSMGVYPTEQEAWDSINDLPGVQGTHPSKGNTYPLRSREYEDCGPVLTWQRYREVVGRSGDYYVVERQVVGTPQATP